MTRRSTRTAGLALAALSLVALSACGGGDDESAGSPDAGATPSCMASLAAVELPTDDSFPADWAFPPGTVITGVDPVPGGGTDVTAVVAAEFEEVLPFMQNDLEDAGFVATQGEAEDDDAEAVWSGGGYSGSWAIRASSSCEGTTQLQVAAVAQ